LFAQAFDRFPFLFRGLQEIQRHVADRGNGQGCIVLTDAAGIITETHVKRPVEGIFDSPMAACVGQHAPGTGRVIAEGITHRSRGGVADETRGGEAGNTLQARPGVLLLKPGNIGRDIAPAQFDPPMACVGFFAGLQGSPGRWLVKEQVDILVSGALIAFETEERVAAPVQNLLCNLALAAHRINRDGRITQVKQG